MTFFREKRFFYNKTIDTIQNSIFPIENNSKLNSSALAAYLYLGYVPGDKTLFENVYCINPIEEIKASANSYPKKVTLHDIFHALPSIEHTKETLKDCLIKSIEKHFEKSKTQIIPLSGGMDSRIILAALCEMTEASNIHTYTFGVPGAYDYDVPNRIARKFGTKHQNFSASDTKYTIDGLIRAAIASDGNTEVFHPIVLNRVVDHYGSSAIYWSGFAGDLVGGAFGEKLTSGDPKQLLINYEKRGIHFLDETDIADLLPLIASGDKMANYVSDAEACFWENHVERYTGHHIFRNDMVVHAPLVDPLFLKFFFTLPPRERQDKKFFNEAFSSLFPDFFDFPTKDYGYKYSRLRYKQLWHITLFYISALAWRLVPALISHPNFAYIDMQHAINNRQDVKSCVDSLFADLARRDLVDNEKMFKFLSAHRSGKANYTKDIINLASLEVILKAAKL